MHISSISRPSPDFNQALVHIKAFGLNRMDLMQREGKYPLPPQAPSTLGVEFSGVIESLGSAARSSTQTGQETPFKPGDEVFGLAYGGAYAEYIVVNTAMLIHKPAELSWETCAGIPETWITALQAMYLIGEWAPGKTILWHAGASGVSIAGIQLSRANGAKAVYATARSAEKCAFCVDELGATAAFDTSAQGEADWAQRILNVTDGKGVDVVVDFIGASYFDQNLDVAARDARIVSLATLGGAKLKGGEDLTRFFAKRIRFEGSGLRSRDEAYQGKLRDQLVEHALPKMKAGEFKIPIEKVFDWEKIVEAHQLMESNKTKGKIICTIPWN